MQLVRLMRRPFLSMNSLASGQDGLRVPGHLLRLGILGLLTLPPFMPFPAGHDPFVSPVVCDNRS